MGDEEVIRRLLTELIDSNRTPEDVCTDRPDLLAQLRQRWRRVRATLEQLDAIFPPSDHDSTARVDPDELARLPRIPGYDVEQVLGHGGMGVVYKAQHLALNRPVALKMVLAGAFAGAPERQRLLREAQAVAALRHPNIVAVYDVGECDGRPYFTMEFVEGATLAQRLAGTPQPARDAARVLATLADAIHAAHQAGIVHRDLKPANVLLTPNGTPKITDFGLARQFEGDAALTLTGVVVGTPSYMAPEQAGGRSHVLGPAVDIYALGALLYEMLTGRPPFRAESALETQRQVLEQDPAPPSRLNARIPRDLETICLKCLQKDPAARYPSARALREDLDRYLNGEPITARRTAAAVRALKWAQRHPARATAWVAALAAAGAILAAVLWTVSIRAAMEQAVRDDLNEVVRLERASDWRAARNTLERAKTRLGDADARDPLAQRAAAIERELHLVDRLAAMRLDRAAARDVEFDQRRWWETYRAAFREAGLLADGDTPAAFAARISQSPARTALVDAMDDMAICAATGADLQWLLEASRRADPDPWRDKARDLTVWSDNDAFAALVRDIPVESQPVPVILNLAGRLLDTAPDEAESLIRRVQAAHPSDFWANFALAEALSLRRSPDAIGYYRAAIALRPEAAVAHVNLAVTLADQDRIDDAIDAMSLAVSLDARSFDAQFALALWLLQARRPEAAVEHALLATQIDPQQAAAYSVHGAALARLGRFCAAAESFRRALELSPQDAQLQTDLTRAAHECDAASPAPPEP